MNLKLLEKRTAKKGQQKSHPYALFFRKAALPITRELIKTNITPNMVSWLNIFLVFVVGVLFILNKTIFLISGIVLLYIIHILDKVDGQMARYKKKFTKQGAFLDEQLHNMLKPIIFVSLGVGLFIFEKNIYSLIGGFLVGLFSLLINNAYLQRLLVLNSQIENRFQDSKINKKIISGKNALGLPIKACISYINMLIKEVLLVFIIIGKIEFAVYFYTVFFAVYWLIHFFIISSFKENKNK